MAVERPAIFICGLGYVGKKLLMQMDRKALSRCSTLSRHVSGVDGVMHHQLDLDELHSHLPFDLNGTCLYYLIPPRSEGLTDVRIRHFLGSLDEAALPERVVFISTTGVYGNCYGDWVDEQRPVSADTDRGRRRLDAETALIEWGQYHRVKVIILRVSGIYGSDKLPGKRLREGRPVLSLSQSPWSNRIHIDDLVQACLKAKDYSGSNVYFNISDGHPSSMSQYFISVARALGLPEPEQISLDECRKIFSDNMMTYLLESKKIDNKRMLRDLGVKLKYADLNAGLEPISRHPCSEESLD